MNFIKLTDTNNNTIFVNMAKIELIKRDTKEHCTDLIPSCANENYISVLERPEEILQLLREAK